ncbi:hypothetical protein HNO51_15370 [Billgrantia sulfidoxydans]|uniref:DUF2125 domain-containing protein n=1 Tax=Billgrantia sulfidoxydans TaxID=2733484 RepID=A0ABX7W6D2_9GAMM|nr:hypothetical protein [Halomonas sulfidoxydans]QTP55943.1 hypothetical protein HNO51_15370 [Halomonas sulfidoxydans]
MQALRPPATRLGQMLAFATLMGACGIAAADAERLEADLRALFGGGGSLSLGEVSSGMLRSRTTAEEIVFETEEGERLLIDRYIVSGDYDAPDEVTLEGFRIEDSLTELTLMSAERIVMGEPSRAVFPLHAGLDPEEVRLGSLAIDGIVLELASELAGELFPDTPLQRGQGRMTIERVRGESLTHDAIGMLEITGVAGAAEDLDEIGSGSFTLASLRLEELTGLDTEGEETLASLLLRDLDVEASELVGSLALLDVDGDFDDGKGGVRLEGLHLDLARMIELAPEEERTQLRMASNVLTDGSGELRLDAAFLGSWQEKGEHSVLVSDSQVDVQDALRLLFDINLPVRLPPGITPADAFADTDWLERATLLGGDMRLNLADKGLFARLATLGAAMEGVTEAQYVEQARTQAQGLGMMFGPEAQAVLLGLVELLEGSAEELEVRVKLPAESTVNSYQTDPLGGAEKLNIKVETR